MSVMDKLMNAMKFNDDDEEFGEDELDEEYYDTSRDSSADRSRVADPEEEEVIPEKKEESTPRLRRKAAETRSAGSRTDGEPSGRAPRRELSPDSAGQVCIIRPTSVNDAREVTDTLLEGSTVVLNLEGLDVEIAQRIIDFTSGSCYAVGGNVQKISHYIFVITPSNIDVSGDLTTREPASREGGSLNMNFATRG